jgi:predicted nucleotidyltransferase
MALSEEEKSALREFKSRLQKVLCNQLIELKVFGSKARGDDRPDSDIDILVIVSSDDWHICDTVYEIATDTLLQTDLCISPKVISKNRFDQLLEEDSAFVRNIGIDAITI